MILLQIQSMSTVLIVSIAAFLIVILLLVSILLYAKAKLLPGGNVNLNINDDEEHQYEVPAGSTLLNTLQNQKILLPSACGGGGTCGMCECEIHEGGGEILPTEKPFFTRKEIKENKRLACQVKVKEDLHIELPEELLSVQEYEVELIKLLDLTHDIKLLTFKLIDPDFMDFKAGQYAQIFVPGLEVFRAYSIASKPSSIASLSISTLITETSLDFSLTT